MYYEKKEAGYDEIVAPDAPPPAEGDQARHTETLTSRRRLPPPDAHLSILPLLSPSFPHYIYRFYISIDPSFSIVILL